MPHRRLAFSVNQALAAQTPAETLAALQNAVEAVVNVANVAWPTPTKDEYADGFARIWHSSLPAAFRRDFRSLVAENGASILTQAALHSPFAATYTEVMQRFQPSGKDRWIFDLLQDHGVRDGFFCPAGPALIGFWSPHPLQGKLALNRSFRMQLEANAAVVGYRLQEFTRKTVEDTEALSPRESAVLRHLASGEHLPEVAERMGISIHTARTHQRRAQRKLGARTPLAAAVCAVRRGLI
jgi:DNA-binding CsgD family transcriptional regulator